MNIFKVKTKPEGKAPAVQSVESANYSVIMLGYNGSGKTTLYCKLTKPNTSPVTNNTPTLGFNKDILTIKKERIELWDIGANVPDLWKHYFSNKHGVIFVVDSCSKIDLLVAQSILEPTLSNPDLQGIPLLVFANKQDKEDSLPISEVTKTLKLDSITGRKWSVWACSGITSSGIMEGMEWLVDAMKK